MTVPLLSLLVPAQAHLPGADAASAAPGFSAALTVESCGPGPEGGDLDAPLEDPADVAPNAEHPAPVKGALLIPPPPIGPEADTPVRPPLPADSEAAPESTVPEVASGSQADQMAEAAPVDIHQRAAPRAETASRTRPEQTHTPPPGPPAAPAPSGRPDAAGPAEPPSDRGPSVSFGDTGLASPPHVPESEPTLPPHPVRGTAAPADAERMSAPPRSASLLSELPASPSPVGDSPPPRPSTATLDLPPHQVAEVASETSEAASLSKKTAASGQLDVDTLQEADAAAPRSSSAEANEAAVELTPPDPEASRPDPETARTRGGRERADEPRLAGPATGAHAAYDLTTPETEFTGGLSGDPAVSEGARPVPAADPVAATPAANAFEAAPTAVRAAPSVPAPPALPPRLAASAWIGPLTSATPQSVEVALAEGDGHVRLRTQRGTDGLAVVVRFSDPELGALAGLHVRQITEALEAHFAEPVQLSLGHAGADGDAPPDQGRPSTSEADRAADPAPSRPTPRPARTLGPYEWIG